MPSSDSTASSSAHARRRSRSYSPAPNSTDRALLLGFYIIVFMGALPGLISGSTSSEAEAATSDGNLYVQVSIALIFLGTLATRLNAFASWHQTIPTGFLLMLLWCWLSLTWAIAPEIGIRRVAQLTMSTIVLFALVQSLGANRSVRYLTNILAVCLVLSVVAALVIPGAIHNDGELAGAWRGIHLDKNGAGAVTSAGTILLIYRYWHDRDIGWRLIWAGLAALSVFFVYKSQSKTSLALVPVACMTGLIYAVAARQRLLKAAWGAVLGAGILAFLFRLDWWQAAFTEMMNDPTSLTGRVQIWGILFEIVEAQPWLGSGYGSFWAIGDPSPINMYAVGWYQWLETVPHAHNGYIDIVLQCGFIGLAIAIVGAFVLPARKVARDKSCPTHLRWLFISILTFIIFHNFLETSLFNSRSPLWIILSTLIAAAYHRERRPAVPAPSRGPSSFSPQSAP